MSPTTWIIGIAVAVVVTIGAGVGLQLLDARMVRARFDEDAEEPGPQNDGEVAEAQPTVKIVHRSANSQRRRRKHGR